VQAGPAGMEVGQPQRQGTLGRVMAAFGGSAERSNAAGDYFTGGIFYL
jgi:hypothetical protein